MCQVSFSTEDFSSYTNVQISFGTEDFSSEHIEIKGCCWEMKLVNVF